MPNAEFTRREPNRAVAKGTFNSKVAIKKSRTGFPVECETLCCAAPRCPARVSVCGQELTIWASKLLRPLRQEDGIEARNRSLGITAMTVSSTSSAGSTSATTLTPVTAGPVAFSKRRERTLWIAGRSSSLI